MSVSFKQCLEKGVCCGAGEVVLSACCDFTVPTIFGRGLRHLTGVTVGNYLVSRSLDENTQRIIVIATRIFVEVALYACFNSIFVASYVLCLPFVVAQIIDASDPDNSIFVKVCAVAFTVFFFIAGSVSVAEVKSLPNFVRGELIKGLLDYLVVWSYCDPQKQNKGTDNPHFVSNRV